MRHFLQIAIALCAFALSSVVHATAQFPDVIVLDGKRHALNTNPLDAHLAKVKWTPPEEAQMSSANWRRYIATWKVEGARLVLQDVTIRVAVEGAEATRSIRTDLFPGRATVVADWYSGALIVPDGEMINYVHIGYGSDYDHYRILRIASGRVLDDRSMTGTEFQAYKAAKFADFMKTDAGRRADAEMRKDAGSLSEEQMREFLMSFHAEQYLSM